MFLKDQLPPTNSLSTKDFLELIPSFYLVHMGNDLANFYAKNYRMTKIMQYFDVEVETFGGDQQVSCSFSEHGTKDIHKSAKYYESDRNTGEMSERVYCWKCEKMSTLYWYILKQAKDHENLNMKDALVWAEQRFGYKVPRDIILNYDIDQFYSFDDSAGGFKKSLSHNLKEIADARTLLKQGNLEPYLLALESLVKPKQAPQVQMPVFENLEI